MRIAIGYWMFTYDFGEYHRNDCVQSARCFPSIDTTEVDRGRANTILRILSPLPSMVRTLMVDLQPAQATTMLNLMIVGSTADAAPDI
jgi:hypothetical protein